MFWLGLVIGMIIFAAIWALTKWYQDRNVQIKEKVVGVINKA